MDPALIKQMKEEPDIIFVGHMKITDESGKFPNKSPNNLGRSLRVKLNR